MCVCVGGGGGGGQEENQYNISTYQSSIHMECTVFKYPKIPLCNSIKNKVTHKEGKTVSEPIKHYSVVFF